MVRNKVSVGVIHGRDVLENEVEPVLLSLDIAHHADRFIEELGPGSSKPFFVAFAPDNPRHGKPALTNTKRIFAPASAP